VDIQLDWKFQALDPNAQQVLINAANAWISDKQTADPDAIAPADGGRVGDEQHPAPVDAIKLIDTQTTDTETVYDIEVSYGGSLDPVSVIIGNDGAMRVQSAE